jgi:hypothetical protein
MRSDRLFEGSPAYTNVNRKRKNWLGTCSRAVGHGECSCLQDWPVNSGNPDLALGYGDIGHDMSDKCTHTTSVRQVKFRLFK